MEPYQQRVVDEKKELDERLEKLWRFMDTPRFVELMVDECIMMRIQARVMKHYSDILGERIEAFVE